MYTRRQFARLAVAALPLSQAAKKINSMLYGVRFGLQSYSFNGLPHDGILDLVISSMVETGLGECDLWEPLIQPGDLVDRMRSASATPESRAQARADLAKWRLSAPLAYFRDIRAKFENAGIDLYGYSGSAGDSEEELNRTFDMADALGVKLLTLGVPLSVAKRLAPLAEKRKMLVGLQGRPNMNATNPDQIARPEGYEAGVALSPWFRISLDIGDATAGGYDVLKFVQDHHAEIALLYIKDRRKDRTSVPWGEGDTPVKQILQLVRDRKYPIRCYIDCDYKSPLGRAADINLCYQYARKVLG